MDEKNVSTSCFDLGINYQKVGRLEDAKKIYKKLLAEEQNQPDVLHRLALIYSAEGDNLRAIVLLEKAIRLAPEHGVFHHNLGSVYMEQQKYRKALVSFKKAVELNPSEGESHFCLGNAYSALGFKAEALGAFEASLEVEPNRPDVLCNLGSTFLGMSEFDQAIKFFKKALALAPEEVEIHYNLGTALLHAEFYEQALLALRRTIAYNPNHSRAWCNIGIILKRKKQYQVAESAFRQALDLLPENPDAHWNYALLLLLLGDFNAGWREYEWRRKIASMRIRHQNQPPWRGENPAQKTILVHSEQGLGDTFQFLRYLGPLKEKAGRIVFEAPSVLVPILQGCPYIDQVISVGESLPKFDVECPLLSLPKFLCDEEMDFVPRPTWLKADEKLVSVWAERLQEMPGKKIGLVWQGNSSYRADKSRSVNLNLFEPILSLEGHHFISLQRGFGSEQIEHLKFGHLIHDFGDLLDCNQGAFVDSAALLEHLDLLICSDTAVAHLAGSMGKKVFLLLSHQPDWRWGRNGKHVSLWYPNTKSFRQATPGDWESVFVALKKALISPE